LRRVLSTETCQDDKLCECNASLSLYRCVAIVVIAQHLATIAEDSISHPFGGHDDCAAAVAGLMVRLVGTRDYRIKSFHVPVVASRSAYMADYVAGIFDPAGGSSCEKPGGWEAGDPRAGGLDAQLGWSINQRN
jgi:hypothetical protein